LPSRVHLSLPPWTRARSRSATDTTRSAIPANHSIGTLRAVPPRGTVFRRWSCC